MTMQFLASVRRNQKQWMVVLTILSIFAFLFDDVVRNPNNLSANSTALIFAVLCAGGMSIVGYPRKHTVLYGTIGFVAGGAAALIGSSFAGSKPVVRTNVGNLSRHDIVQLHNGRAKANRFVGTIVVKATKQGGAAAFGDLNQSSLVGFSVLKQEAKRMGVVISDEGISAFIKRITQGKLTRKDYEASLREVGVTEAEIFELIRSELEAQLVSRLLSPPATVSQSIEQTNMFNQMLGRPQIPSRAQVMTPEQLWQNFRKLNVREALTAVEIPISEFVKQVQEPSETELKEYFEKRKGLVGDDRGNPGFLEPPKVKVGYLVASNIEAYETGLTGATDEEIVQFYLAHKEEFRVFDIPDMDSNLKIPVLKGSDSIDAPADASAPANVAVEKPETAPALSNPPATEKPDGAKPEGTKPDDVKPGNATPEKKEPEKKGDGAAKAEDKPKDESNCGGDETKKEAEAKKDAAEAEVAKPAKEDAPKPATEDVKPAKEGAKEEIELPQPASETPPAPALPSSGEATPKLTPPNFGPAAPPKYRDLDDDLKLEIGGRILLEKAFAKMGAARDKAVKFMEELNLEYVTAEKSSASELASTFAEKCKDYAAKNGLEYHETKEMAYRELRDSLDERIGGAAEPSTEKFPRRNVQTVADVLFESDPTGQNYRLSLFDPRSADSPKMRYAYWKIAVIPAREPDLKNEVTHQLVVDSWKFEKARALAEKRAKEFADLVKKSPTDIPAALAGQTVNGAAESPAVTIRETPKFTWMHVQQSVPTMGFGMDLPVESSIRGIDNPGSDFMKLVFEQLAEGEVGVALNRSKTVFYVVRVHDRDASGTANDGGVALQEMQQKFLNEPFTGRFATPYDFLGIEVQQFVDSHWRQNFNKRFAITFEETNSPGSEEE